MTANSHVNGAATRDASALAVKVASFVSKFATDLLAKSKSVLRATQTARLMSVLSSMSDTQLHAIGITRADIPKHAEKLMSDGEPHRQETRT